jgi:hypothetical protein
MDINVNWVDRRKIVRWLSFFCAEFEWKYWGSVRKVSEGNQLNLNLHRPCAIYYVHY